MENQRAYEEQVKSETAQDHIICDDVVNEVHEAIEKDEVKAIIPEKLEKEKKPIDEGKVMALYKAKWSQKKIADEMGCSQARISQIIRTHKG